MSLLSTALRAVVYTVMVALLLGFALALSAGAEAVFRSEVSRDGNTVQVRYVLASDKALPRNLQPRFPDFKGFRKLSGPAIGTSISIVNGASSHETSWSFVLQPEAQGTLGIGSASVEVEGRLLTVQARTVTVIPEAEAAEAPVLLRAEVSNNRPVVGEKVLLRYKLYYNVQVQGYDIEDLPSSAGFLRENLEDIQRPQTKTESYRGQDWNVAVIREIALFPTKDGRLEIPSLNGRVNLLDNKPRSRQKQRNMLDDFFGGDPFRRMRTEILPSNAITLDVQPLPSGAPAGFTGAVGQYTLSAKPDRTELAAGEAITLTTAVSGEGNVSLLPLLEPELSHGLEKYDTQQESEIRRSAGSFGGTRRFKTLIVARTEGEQTIGALRLVYFDPKAKQYKTLSAGPWTLQVAEGSRSMVESQSGFGVRAGKVESYGQDIRHILDVPAELAPQRPPLHRRWGWRLLIAACVLAPLVTAVRVRQLRLDTTDPLNFRRRRAAGEAGRRLAAARKALAKDDPSRALKELDDALARYLADRLGRPAGELVLEELALELTRSGRLGEEPAALLTRFRRNLDLARYGSGEASARERVGELIHEGEALLKELRRVLEGGRS